MTCALSSFVPQQSAHLVCLGRDPTSLPHISGDGRLVFAVKDQSYSCVDADSSARSNTGGGVVCTPLEVQALLAPVVMLGRSVGSGSSP